MFIRKQIIYELFVNAIFTVHNGKITWTGVVPSQRHRLCFWILNQFPYHNQTNLRGTMGLPVLQMRSKKYFAVTIFTHNTKRTILPHQTSIR